VIDDYVWHVRGIQVTHIGPYNGLGVLPIARIPPTHGRHTECGMVMDATYVPGFGVTAKSLRAPLCERCRTVAAWIAA
jgi:hypothetical protein